MLLCAITDRLSLPSPDLLLDRAADWADGGVDFIQLREKDLAAVQLRTLALQLRARIAGSRSKLLVNQSVSALLSAAGSALHGVADGVHLAGRPTPGVAGAVRGKFPGVLISVPCHSLEDVRVAVVEQVDLLLFSPVFEKLSATPQGLEVLHQACLEAQGIPVFALGGVTIGNAPACITAGAAGVAGIRLFAAGDWRRLHDI